MFEVKLDLLINKSAIKSKAITGNSMWQIADRNNRKPKVVKIARMNGTVEYLKD